MHILPDLNALEKQFSIKDGLVVVSIYTLLLIVHIVKYTQLITISYKSLLLLVIPLCLFRLEYIAQNFQMNEIQRDCCQQYRDIT